MESTTPLSDVPNWRFYGDDLFILLDTLVNFTDYDEVDMNSKSLKGAQYFFYKIRLLPFNKMSLAKNIYLVEDREVYNFDELNSPRFQYIKDILEFFELAGLEEKITFLSNDISSNYFSVRHRPITSFLLNYPPLFKNPDRLLSYRKFGKKSRFLLLNRKPKIHRKEIFNFLKESDLLKYTLYSQDNYIHPERMILGDNFVSLPTYFIKNSLINIVTETFFYYTRTVGFSSFITEKTVKCLYSMMPFIVVGPAHTLKHLKDLGYKTFDSIWDESYDDCIGDENRMRAIKKTILDIGNWSDSELEGKIPIINDITLFNYKRYCELYKLKENLTTYSLDSDTHFDFVFYDELLNLVKDSNLNKVFT